MNCSCPSHRRLEGAFPGPRNPESVHADTRMHVAAVSACRVIRGMASPAGVGGTWPSPRRQTRGSGSPRAGAGRGANGPNAPGAGDSWPESWELGLGSGRKTVKRKQYCRTNTVVPSFKAQKARRADAAAPAAYTSLRVRPAASGGGRERGRGREREGAGGRGRARE